MTRLLRLAHRGDHRVHPENSVAALLAALAVPGIDGVEMDVRLSADGVAVLSHDPFAGTAATLARAGFATLHDAVAAMPITAFLDVELKEWPGDAAVELLAEARGHTPRRACVSSFDPAVLRRAGEVLAGWPRWLNADVLDEASVAAARSVAASGIAAGVASIDAAGIALAESASLEVFPWTVTDPVVERRLADLGVAGVIVEGDALEIGDRRGPALP